MISRSGYVEADKTVVMRKSTPLRGSVAADTMVVRHQALCKYRRTSRQEKELQGKPSEAV